MTLERGFRRLTIVGSVVVLALGATIDAIGPVLVPHATVEVTIKDGRKFILERHGSRAFLTDMDSLRMALPEESWGPPRREPGRTEYAFGYNPPSGTSGTTVQDLPDVLSVRVIRGPEYWWWTDTVWTKAAAVLGVLLWIALFVVRWIVRGFVG